MLRNLKARMTYANVASTIALVVAVGGGGAAVAVSMVPANSVGTNQIINGAVRTADLHAGAVTGPKIRSRAINTPRKFGTGNLGIVRAYALNDSLAADADLTNNGYTYNRSGGPVTVNHQGTGKYNVTFDNLNLSGGTVVVTPYAGSATICNSWGWGPNSALVHCYNSAGVLTNSYFTVAMID